MGSAAIGGAIRRRTSLRSPRRLLLAGLLAALLGAAAPSPWAQAVRIAQIDSSRLLLDQTVNLYVSVTDSAGEPVAGLEQNRFRVYESAGSPPAGAAPTAAAGGTPAGGPGAGLFREVPIVRFRPGANRTDGINFLLLIDNSGSMYDTLQGQPTEQEGERRISQAKEAVRAFLNSITNPRDTVGLASFNTSYARQTPPSGRIARITDLLDTIERPSPEQAYTELYAALTQGAEDLSGYRGRRVLIVLSDGENYPYAVHSGRPHPRFGRKVFAYTEPIELAQREGISIFAVNFGPQKDPKLASIAVDTGGAVFDAADREQLSEVYTRIRERVRQEYLIGYRATMDPAERKLVRVEAREEAGIREATRFYYSSTVFGLPARNLSYLLILPFLLAAALWWLLTRLKLEREALRPALEVLRTHRGAVSTRLFDLGGGKTVIGGGEGADLTISGVPSVRREHATVLYDPAEKSYTIVGEGDITVNNQPVRRRKLEEGDVINVEGTTIVFHGPGPEKQRREPPPREPPPRGRPERRGPPRRTTRKSAPQAPRKGPKKD